MTAGPMQARARMKVTPLKKDSLCIVVLGYVVRGPLGGLVWHHLQYLMGLHRLGHDVYLLEDSDDYASCYDPSRDAMSQDPAYGLAFAAQTLAGVGLGDRWAYYDAHTSRWFGPSADKVMDLCSRADLLLNISNVNPLRPWTARIPVKALIDTDPVFTQIRLLTDPTAGESARSYERYYTFGENYGQPGCGIPQDGLPWKPTRQPVVLDAWPVTPGPHKGRFTTVMQWESYPEREYQGQKYGMKSASFAHYLDLPRKTGAALEMAVGSASAPRTMLAEKGWHVLDPLQVARSPWTYQEYIRQSKAEFTVAKHGYVVSRSGWFSERSTATLPAAGPW